MTERRLKSCVEHWPDCWSDGYDPRCCRFPKSCSCTTYPDGTPEEHLEPAPIEISPGAFMVVTEHLPANALETFVRARLDEREAEAYLAAEDTHRDWQQTGQSVYGNDRLVVSTMVGGAWSAVRHITANDPAHVLRDIAAKRDIVDAYASARRAYDEGPGFDLAVLESLEMTVQLLAAIDITHSDFRREWL